MAGRRLLSRRVLALRDRRAKLKLCPESLSTERSLLPLLFFTFLLLIVLSPAGAEEPQTPALVEQQANELLKAGDQAFDKAENPRAETSYLQAYSLFESIQSRKGSAEASFKLAKTFEKLTRYDKAMEWVKRALALHQELSDSSGIGFDLTEMAFLEILKGNYGESLSLCERALRIHEEIGDKKGIFEARLALATRAHYTGDYEESTEFFRECLLISKETGDQQQMVRALNGLGMVQASMGNLDDALSYLQEALPIAVQRADTERIAQVRLNLGRVYWRQGSFSKALEQYEASLQISEASGNQRGVNINLNNIALVYLDQGFYAEALRTHERSLKIRREAGDKQGTATSLENIGLVYLKIGDTSRALEYLREALDIVLEIGGKKGIGSTRNNIGIALESQGDTTAALNSHLKALGIFEEIGDKRGTATSHYFIAVNQLDLGNFDQALEHQQKALEIATEMADRKWMSMSLSSLGMIYYRMGAWEKAKESLSESIRISQEIGFSEPLWASLHTLGLVQASEGNTEMAISSLKAAVDVVENVRQHLQMEEEEKASFLGDKLQIYSDLIEILVDGNRAQEAFEYSESSKARAFLDMLAEARIDPKGNLDPELATRKGSLESRYAQIQKALRDREEKSNPQDPAIKRLEKERQDLEEEYLALRREIRIKNPDYADLTYPHPLKSQEVEETLDGDTVLLEYSLGKKKSYLFGATSESVAAFPLAGEGQISEKVQELRELILKPEPVWENLERSHERLFKVAQDLYRILIQPAESKLQGKHHLIVVPDGILNYLPFEVLIRGPVAVEKADSAELPYLVADYELYYAPSATVLFTIRARAEKEQQAGRRDLIAFADPDYGTKSDALSAGNDVYRMAEALGSLSNLPNTRREVEEIARWFPKGKVTEFFGKSASEKNVKSSRLEDYRYVHFAAHGLVREDQPQFSSLVLSFNKAEKEDGLLMMREIFDLKLNADLVVLSACKTGLGQQIRGEGVRGLSRAFLYAGTTGVLVSLWNVSDRSTADFMGIVYRNMEKGKMNKAAALRQARLEMMRGGKYSHPYYWAPFVLIGNP